MKFNHQTLLIALAGIVTSNTSTLFVNATDNNNHNNNHLRTSSSSNHDAADRQLLDIPDDIFNLFIEGAMLVGDTSDYLFQTIHSNNMFKIDGEEMDDSQFQKITLRDDKPLSESRLYQRTTSDGEIILRKSHSGSIEHVAKVKSDTGEKIFVEHLFNNHFIEFSSNDIDESLLDGFVLGDMQPPTRKLTENNNNNNNNEDKNVELDQQHLYGEPSSHRQLQEGCDDITVIRVAVRYSSTFCQDQGNNRDDAEMYLQEIFALMNLSYQVSGLCKRVEICNMEGACNDSMNTQYDDIADSSTACGGNDNTLDKFINEVIDAQYINSNQCDLAQFVYGVYTGEGVPGGTIIGCAYSSSLCNYYAGGVNDFQFSRNMGLRTTLVAHEAGHNLGSGHDGNNQRGFIMQPSVCSCDEFSANSVNQINSYVGSRASSTCTRTEEPYNSPTAAPSAAPTPEPEPECEDLNFVACGASRDCYWFLGCRDRD